MFDDSRRDAAELARRAYGWSKMKTPTTSAEPDLRERRQSAAFLPTKFGYLNIVRQLKDAAGGSPRCPKWTFMSRNASAADASRPRQGTPVLVAQTGSAGDDDSTIDG
jgi:hypothetical protein